MIRSLRVRDVGALHRGHMAANAIRLLPMTARRELRSMARQALAAEIRRAVLRLWCRMRIMTRCAAHRIARLLLTNALPQSLKLAARAQSLPTRIGLHEVSNEIGNRITRAKIIKMATALLNCRISFEMTLHADRIPLRRAELRRIHNRPAAPQMHARVSVAALARHSGVLKRWLGIPVLRSRRRRRHPARMTKKAACNRRKI